MNAATTGHGPRATGDGPQATGYVDFVRDMIHRVVSASRPGTPVTKPLSNRIAHQLKLSDKQVAATLALLDDGNTVPFIARYRKERTGGLDEVQIRDVQDQADAIRALESRRETILDSIEEQGAMTSELRKQLQAAETLARLEDLYAPYRPRRATRATKAREAGLEPLAEALLNDVHEIKSLARELLSDEYPDVGAALSGARDIIAEEVADDAEIRRELREVARKHGRIASKKRRGADEETLGTYKTYVGFSAPVGRIREHQVLALRRGEAEKALSVGLDLDDERQLRWICRKANPAQIRFNREQIDDAIADGYKRLLFPAIERDIRGELEEQADEHAIGVFAVNLKNLLMQPPTRGRILGIDPGLRTGCKLVAIDETGRPLAPEGGNGSSIWTDQIYVHDGRQKHAPEKVAAVIDRHAIDIVAIGNGTGSRQTEEVVTQALSLCDRDAKYTVVDEAGASIYSASDIARQEFPDLDISMRGAISIARRLQDPLAELVKIDPKSIGVGLYQHDVNQTRLAEKLDAVVEDVVNGVGIELNRASAPLLARVAGIGPVTGERIVAHRNEAGPFRRRRDLKKVKGIGAKTYEQCAGFLRVADGDEPLDNTGIHPERYAFAKAVLKAAGAELGSAELRDRLRALTKRGGTSEIAAEHEVGSATVEDVLAALVRPGRDPRDELDAPILRAESLSMDDLQEGMKLTGTVRNVVDFGAFVDIGVKQDGLIHVSEMADRYVKDPHSIVSVGDRVDVTVVSVDTKRGRIGLSLKR